MALLLGFVTWLPFCAARTLDRRRLQECNLAVSVLLGAGQHTTAKYFGFVASFLLTISAT